MPNVLNRSVLKNHRLLSVVGVVALSIFIYALRTHSSQPSGTAATAAPEAKGGNAAPFAHSVEYPSGHEASAEIGEGQPEPLVFDPDTDDVVTVGTPGCGLTERWLTLPERNAIPEEKQEPVRELLENLRRTLEDRLPIEGPLDDDLRRNGSLQVLSRRWRALPPERRTTLIQTLDSGSSQDSFAEDVRFVRTANAAAFEEFVGMLAPSVKTEAATAIWVSELSWCSVALRQD